MSKNNRKDRLILSLCMFIMGGSGLAYEYTFSKIAADILGNSVQQWAITIGLMLFCMGVGAELTRYIKKESIIRSFALSQLTLAILGGLGPILLIFMYGKFPYQYSALHYSLISICGILIGFEIPLIVRQNQSYSSELRVNLAEILKVDYIGALFGALVWTFLLPKFLILTETAALLGISSTLTGLALLYFFHNHQKIENWIWITSFLVLGILGGSFFQAKNWTTVAEQSLYRDHIKYTATTRYQHIVLTESPYGMTNLYINGHLQFSSADEHIYHEFLVHPAMHVSPNHQNILVLGGGDGLAVREILKYPTVRKIDLVDLDPEITKLARENPELLKLNQASLSDAKVSLLENQSLITGKKVKLVEKNQKNRFGNQWESICEVNLYHLDASVFIEQIPRIYDLIVIDLPDPNSPDLAKLYSKYFYSNLMKKLGPGGIVVQQSTSPAHAREAFLCIGRTMEAAGLEAEPYHENIPSFGDWGWWIAKNPNTFTEKPLKEQLNSVHSLSVPTKHLTRQLIQSSLHFGKNQLTTKETSISTLGSPMVYEYYLQAWKGY